MKNMKKKKVERRTKEELIKSNKNRRRIIILLLGVVAYFIISGVWNSTTETINEIDFTNESDIDCSDSDEGIAEYVKGFIYGILSLEYAWITKLLIFLGAVYLINVTITISGDIIQLVLIIGVAIIRFIRWSYRKIKGIEDEE